MSLKKSREENTLWPEPAIAIVGNMNVGKTTLFSKMCNSKTESVNLPGNTVSIKRGKIKGARFSAFDTPGIFSIFSSNEDERASRDIFISMNENHRADGVVVVADAKNLKRSLAVLLQFSEYRLPMILDINMIDEIAQHGITLDIKKLSEILGVDIVTTVARDGMGVSKLVSGLAHMKRPSPLIEYPEVIERFLNSVETMIKDADISSRAVGLLLLTGDKGVEKYIESRFGQGMLNQLQELLNEYSLEDPQKNTLLLSNLYFKKADQVVNDVQTTNPPLKHPMAYKIGDWCIRLSTGIPIAIGVLYATYLFVGKFGATFLVDMINGTVFEDFLIPWTSRLIAPLPNDFIRDMIIDPDFGILPTGIFLAVGLVMPVLFCFYIAFGILQDSGYLARISILLDRVLKKMGLNGKGIIPLVMGFSCVTMAILTTRMLDTKKERNIATFLLLLGMPCAPLLAVMLIILSKMPVSATITVFGIIFGQIFLAGYLINKILPGSRTPLFMEIPPFRIPKPFQIIQMSALKTYFFMKEAIPVFIFASIFVFLFDRMGGLALLEKAVAPVIKGFMGLPEKSVQVFIKTIIRRESGATEIQHLSAIYDNVQMVVNLLVMTFLLPCINATIVLFKERGTKTAAVILMSVVVYAIMMGGVVSHVCRYFGVTFT